MPKILELYRGDETKIDEFKFNKTDKHCLFGQGVYLTDNKQVAESYRIKGSRVYDNEILLSFMRFPSDSHVRKEPVLKEAFDKFVEFHWKERFNYSMKTTSKEYQRLVDELSDVWYYALKDGTITVDKTYNYGIRVKIDSVTIRVIWKRLQIGYLSVFQFDNDYLLRNIINLDAGNFDTEFLKLVYEHKISIFSDDKFIQVPSVDEFINRHRHSRICGGMYTKKAWAKLRNILKPYGIIGFQYDGGIRIGGSRRHRAFVIWDEDYVNNHKVACLS